MTARGPDVTRGCCGAGGGSVPRWSSLRVRDVRDLLLRRRPRCERTRVVPHILRPLGAALTETTLVACEQCARRFLESRLIARHRGHEPVRGFLRLATTVGPGPRLARFVGEPSHSRR